MKPYGVRLIEHPDVIDIQEMGSQGCVGHIRRKSGDFHSYIRNSDAKARTRRYWKRQARQFNKDACEET